MATQSEKTSLRKKQIILGYVFALNSLCVWYIGFLVIKGDFGRGLSLLEVFHNRAPIYLSYAFEPIVCSILLFKGWRFNHFVLPWFFCEMFYSLLDYYHRARRYDFTRDVLRFDIVRCLVVLAFLLWVGFFYFRGLILKLQDSPKDRELQLVETLLQIFYFLGAVTIVRMYYYPLWGYVINYSVSRISWYAVLGQVGYSLLLLCLGYILAGSRKIWVQLFLLGVVVYLNVHSFYLLDAVSMWMQTVRDQAQFMYEGILLVLTVTKLYHLIKDRRKLAPA